MSISGSVNSTYFDKEVNAMIWKSYQKAHFLEYERNDIEIPR